MFSDYYHHLYDVFCCRWKEKLFLLTSEHIHCFKKTSLQGLAQTQDYMFRVRGGEISRNIWQVLLYQVKLERIAEINMFEKKGFLTVCLIIAGICRRRLLLRKAEGLRDWFNIIKVDFELSNNCSIMWHKVETYNNKTVWCIVNRLKQLQAE